MLRYIVSLVAMTSPLLAHATAASAEPSPPELKFGLGVGFAIFDVAGAEVSAAAARGEISHNLGPLQLVGDLSLGYAVHAVSAGAFARTSIAARLPLFGHHDKRDGGFGLVDIGVGWHRLPTPDPIGRPDVSLGGLFEIREGDFSMVISIHFVVAEEPTRSFDVVVAGASGRRGLLLDVGLITNYGVRW